MGKPYILVVDDDEDIREMLGILLKNEGYDVATASSGAEGLKIMEDDLQREFNVVITDIMMPDMTGVEFLKKIKNFSMTVEVIMMTGYSTIERAMECIELGAFSYLEKPFGQLEDILDRVARALDNQHHKKEIILQAYKTVRKKKKGEK